MASDRLQALAEFSDPEDEGQLASLDALIGGMRAATASDAELDALFGIFERFPDHDGFGVFWSVLHFLEATPGHEHALLRSVARAPVEFNILMINRLINGSETGTAPWLDLLSRIRDDSGPPGAVRRHASGFLEYQQTRRHRDD